MINEEEIREKMSSIGGVAFDIMRKMLPKILA